MRMSVGWRIASPALPGVLAVLISSATARSANPECESALAIAAALDGAGPWFVAPRPLRREDLDDRFGPPIAKQVLFHAYEMVEDTVTAPDGQRFSLLTSHGSAWVIAFVSTECESAYVLHGSVDPLSGFNAVVSRLDIRVGSGATASLVAWRYAELARQFSDRIVSKPEEALLRIESQLVSSGVDGVRRKGTRWFRRNARSLAGVAPMGVVEQENGFHVTFYVAAEGAIVRHEVRVARDGQIEELAAERVTTVIEGFTRLPRG